MSDVLMQSTKPMRRGEERKGRKGKEMQRKAGCVNVPMTEVEDSRQIKRV